MVRYRGLEILRERGCSDMLAEGRVPVDRAIGELAHERLGRALMGFAHTDTDARQIIEKEIRPMIGRQLDDYIGPCGIHASAELAISRGHLRAARLRQKMPIARDQRR